MEHLVGLVLSVAVAGIATVTGFDRERVFYPTVLIAIAFYYVLFAAMGAPGQVVLIESLVAGGFSLVAIIGFRTNLWLVAAALVGHGAFDLVHHRLIENPAVPDWWPGFCTTVDVVLGFWLGWLLAKRADFTLQPTPLKRRG